MAKFFHVTDEVGDLTLRIEEAEEGGFIVSSIDPDENWVTQAETLEKAFENARDAKNLLENTQESR